MSKVALISGITGQDGSYLAEQLLDLGYQVHGIIRRSSTFNTSRLEDIYQDPHDSQKFFLHYGDLTDGSGLRRILAATQPDEVYNLGAQSHVRVSFDQAEYTTDVVYLGTLRFLEAIRDVNPKIRFYQASSSEMYGDAQVPVMDEKTPFRPVSPYAIAKVAAFNLVRLYRESYGLFACNGILFNHESPRRGETFVTRKITRAASRIAHGLQDVLYLGNLHAKRDWGYAPEFTEAMHLMLAQDEPDDYVISTGEAHTVQEFVQEAFVRVDLDPDKYVKVDPRYYRPQEVPFLLGDSTKAKRNLGWKPKIKFRELAHLMMEADLELARLEKTAYAAGAIRWTSERTEFGSLGRTDS